MSEAQNFGSSPTEFFMDIFARITSIINRNYKNEKKEARFFKLTKDNKDYYWAEVFGDDYLRFHLGLDKPMLNFYIKEYKFKIDHRGYIAGFLFEDWHLSKWATRFNGCNRKNK